MEDLLLGGISQKLEEAGAELAFTYLGDVLKKRVIPLAEKLNYHIFYFSYHESFETKKKFYKIYIKKIIKA